MKTNWAGNFTYHAKQIQTPSSVEELQEIIHQSSSVKAIGSRHTFNDIADTSHTHIDLSKLAIPPIINEQNQTVTVSGGIRYGELAQFLESNRYALHNLASLPHITVAGACTTATHGSGKTNGNLATAIREIEFVLGTGEFATFSKKSTPETFAGVLVHLGALGIITKITLKIQPTYQVQQNVFLDLPIPETADEFDVIMSSAYSVSLFTDWQTRSFTQVWLKQRTDQINHLAESLQKATPATRNYHPLKDIPAENCTSQMGSVGAWHERLPHFQLQFQPSQGDELQSEYFVPFEYALPAMEALYQLREKMAPIILVGEVRTIAKDDLWLSPCYEQDCVAFHFTWVQDMEKVLQFLPLMEDALIPYRVRPHWGKLFTLDSTYLRNSYPKFGDFQKLIQRYDPEQKFQNSFLQRVFHG